MDLLKESKAEAHLSKNALANITKWLEHPKYVDYRQELIGLIQGEKWDVLEDSFFKVLEFGTAGRRGEVGIGSNRINLITVGESAQALCEYAAQFVQGAKQKGIVIAYDTRLSSVDLSQQAASVCAANGFKTYIFDGFRSTPELSFAVRELGCAAGIVISASHNPPKDNGFKVCWTDGGQLVAPHDQGILKVAANIQEIKSVDYQTALKDQKIIEIGSEIDQKYIEAVLDQAEGSSRDLKIIYSPLHGTGQTSTLPVLKKAGFEVQTIPEQMVPDGNFPTVLDQKPNPEEKSANDAAVKQLLESKADIAITNDPDADRVGVMVRRGQEVIYLNGNQTAALATEYVLRKKAQRQELTKEHYIAKTIVTTDLLDAVAKHFKVDCYGNLLIGFKYIGELIAKQNQRTFIIGGEESYGLLKGDYARDKDGAIGALLIAEYAAELKLEGKTLWDRLLELYRQYGLFVEQLENIYCLGAKGFQEMQAMMSKARNNPPKTVGGHQVSAILDYQTLQKTDLKTGQTSPIDCITGNVVVFEFGDKSRRITIRPSGTEPKIKLYVQWFERDCRPDIENQIIELQAKLKSIAGELESALKT